MKIVHIPIPDDTPAPIPLMYIRIVENFQSIHLLLSKGIISPAEVIVRSMLECTFQLVAMQKTPSLLQDYLDAFEEERLNALSHANKFSGALAEDAQRYGIQNKYSEQLQKINEIRFRRFGNPSRKNKLKKAAFEWAKHAEMTDFYRLHYVTYSSATHGNAIALENHLDGDSTAFGPTPKGLSDCLVCAMQALAHSMKAIAYIKQMSIDDELEQFGDRLTDIQHMLNNQLNA